MCVVALNKVESIEGKGRVLDTRFWERLDIKMNLTSGSAHGIL